VWREAWGDESPMIPQLKQAVCFLVYGRVVIIAVYRGKRSLEGVQASVDGESLLSGNADNKMLCIDSRRLTQVGHICSGASRDVIYRWGHRLTEGEYE